MKIATLSFLFLLIIGSVAYGQNSELRRLVVPRMQVDRQALYHVVSQASDTLSRVEKPSGFRLGPGEKKASVIIGKALERIDKPVENAVKGDSGITKVFVLPEVYYARIKGSEEQISYRILFLDAAPLRYNFEKKEFEGSISFLAREESPGTGNAVTKILSEPEQIFVSVESRQIPISLTQVNWPPVYVDIVSNDPVDSLTVKVLTINNPTGYQKKLPIEPAIILNSNRQTINGFGVQTIPLTVSLKGVSSGRQVQVSFESSYGSLSPASILLVNDQSQVVNLRSEGTGDIEVKPVSANYRTSPPLLIHAIVPVFFLICAVLGGFLGSLARILKGRKKIKLRPLAYGTLFGCLVSLAYWGVGIMLIKIPFTFPVFNEVAVLVLSMLAGLIEWDDISKLMGKKL
ncbi:MAG: hypothetical protein HXX13_14725 [Bacteroidetes bacterium]|nr:hypothetical protein [Bacteroidota bacterium]